MFTVTLDEALVLLAREKKRARRGPEVLKVVGTHPDTGAEIRLLKGRYGPYVTDGEVNAGIPKGRDPMGDHGRGGAGAHGTGGGAEEDPSAPGPPPGRPAEGVTGPGEPRNRRRGRPRRMRSGAGAG